MVPIIPTVAQGPVFTILSLRLFRESNLEERCQAILNINSVNMQYDILMKLVRTPYLQFFIINSGFNYEKIMQILRTRVYHNYTGSMSSPLITELDRLIKLNIPKTVIIDSYYVSEV